MKIKFLLAAILLSLLTLGFISDKSTIEWEVNLEKAFKRAKKENKSVVLYFSGSDWCSPCKSLEVQVFQDSKFSDFSEDLILVKCDIPRQIDLISEEQMTYNKILLEKHNPEKKFPKLLSFSKKGKKLNEINGYSSESKGRYHFEFLKELKKD